MLRKLTNPKSWENAASATCWFCWVFDVQRMRWWCRSQSELQETYLENWQTKRGLRLSSRLVLSHIDSNLPCFQGWKLPASMVRLVSGWWMVKPGRNSWKTGWSWKFRWSPPLFGAPRRSVASPRSAWRNSCATMQRWQRPWTSQALGWSRRPSSWWFPWAAQCPMAPPCVLWPSCDSTWPKFGKM